MRFRSWTPIRKVTVYGAPVYAHWSVLLGIAIFGLLSLGSPIYAVVAIASYLSVIATHEIGHAFIAHRLGYHVEAVRISAIHGVCECEAPDTEWEHVLISWGGVGAQITLAMAVFLLAAAIGDRDAHYFGPVIVFLGYFNFMLAIVNLAPSEGLDGSVAWRIIPLALQHYRARRTVKKRVIPLARRKRSNKQVQRMRDG
jgi:hypothetical protein